AGDRRAVVENQRRLRLNGAAELDFTELIDVDGDTVQRDIAVAATLHIHFAAFADVQRASGDRGAVNEAEDRIAILHIDFDGPAVGYGDIVEPGVKTLVVEAALALAADFDIDGAGAADRQRAAGDDRAVSQRQRRGVLSAVDLYDAIIGDEAFIGL